MDTRKSVEDFKGNDGFLVVQIMPYESGTFEAWKRKRMDKYPGRKHNHKSTYQDLSAARAKSLKIVDLYNQDRTQK